MSHSFPTSSATVSYHVVTEREWEHSFEQAKASSERDCPDSVEICRERFLSMKTFDYCLHGDVMMWQQHERWKERKRNVSSSRMNKLWTSSSGFIRHPPIDLPHPLSMFVVEKHSHHPFNSFRPTTDSTVEIFVKTLNFISDPSSSCPSLLLMWWE